jgi:hypothetical protein
MTPYIFTRQENTQAGGVLPPAFSFMTYAQFFPFIQRAQDHHLTYYPLPNTNF